MSAFILTLWYGRHKGLAKEGQDEGERVKRKSKTTRKIDNEEREGEREK